MRTAKRFIALTLTAALVAMVPGTGAYRALAAGFAMRAPVGGNVGTLRFPAASPRVGSAVSSFSSWLNTSAGSAILSTYPDLSRVQAVGANDEMSRKALAPITRHLPAGFENSLAGIAALPPARQTAVVERFVAARGAALGEVEAEIDRAVAAAHAGNPSPALLEHRLARLADEIRTVHFYGGSIARKHAAVMAEVAELKRIRIADSMEAIAEGLKDGRGAAENFYHASAAAGTLWGTTRGSSKNIALRPAAAVEEGGRESKVPALGEKTGRSAADEKSAEEGKSGGSKGLRKLLSGFPKGTWALIAGSVVLQFGIEILGTTSAQFIQTLSGGGAMILSTMAITRISMATLAGGIGGPLADRYSAKKLLIWSHLLAGIPILAAVGLSWAGLLTAPIFLIPLALAYLGRSGYSGGVGGVATKTAVARLAGNDEEAAGKVNSLLQLLLEVPGTLGPIISGLLMAGVGMTGALAFNPLLFLVGVLPFIALPALMPRGLRGRGEAKVGFVERLTKGFKDLFGDKTLRWPFMFFTVLTLMHIALYTPLAPLYAGQMFPSNPAMLGWMLGIYSAGGGIGALFSSFNPFKSKLLARIQKAGLPAWTRLSMLALPLFWGMAFVSNPFVIVAMMGLYGLMTVPAEVKLLSAIQARAAPEAKGRIMGAVVLISSLITLANLILLGGVFEMAGAMGFPILAAAVSIIAAIGLFGASKLKKPSK